ncbi:mononuclear molybdenum enzyme YedY [Helicobacter valdiviensis]|uniref:Mononuclear molybdenum enzyme YedY n=1 Tax=Helicobacter valdiviensis TaxID=1458358 RepID=A0A2W6NKP9_9HELI|nr:protein-methionine-sulfoxide reductase catalytic subunit MsrP [Helicobacter valdiviensis]PZT47976.1 mononuclear molybdenum enzyme YedY [Helicobacter valdiviensis]
MKSYFYKKADKKELTKITQENIFNKRREFLKLGAGSMAVLLGLEELLAKTLDTKNIINPFHYEAFSEAEALRINGGILEPTLEEIATSYNNFYEFGYSKSDPKENSKDFKSTPWKIEVTGEVEKPFSIDLEDLIAKMHLKERIYRFRCVEAWSMVIPWIGFELREFIEFAKVKSSAKYIKFSTKYDPSMFPMQGSVLGVSKSFLPFPYEEALRLDEAKIPLTLLAVGMYGKPLSPQNGAPIRLVVPWKYGYKMIKSIDKIEFLTSQPLSTWEAQNPKEYGFYGNVDPSVSHPRWSQSSERVIGQRGRVRTLYLNGYAKEVEHLYAGLDRKKLY